jgi:hypothetical protein
MWQSQGENEHYSGRKLLRKTRLKLGVMFAFVSNFIFEPKSFHSILLLVS